MLGQDILLPGAEEICERKIYGLGESEKRNGREWDMAPWSENGETECGGFGRDYLGADPGYERAL